MLRCPKCGGYGKAMSTRNIKDSVVRYHKCDNCGETFTSTQRVNNQLITNETIDSLLQSDEFNLLIYPLFQSFGLIDFTMHNNTTILPELYIRDFVISSVLFDDQVKGCSSRFDIYIKAIDDKFNGVIKLVSFPEGGTTKYRVDAILGTISNLNGKAELNLDIPTINRIINL